MTRSSLLALFTILLWCGTANATLTVVQTKTAHCSASSPCSATFDSDTTTGNTIAVMVAGSGIYGGPTAVTDDFSNTYGEARDREEQQGNNAQHVWAYWTENMTGGASHTVQVDITESGGESEFTYDVVIYELHSDAGVGAIMTAKSKAAWGSSTTPSTGNITTDESAVWIGMVFYNNASTFTQDASWTEVLDSGGVTSAYYIQAATTADYSPGPSGASADWVCNLVAFVEVSAHPLLMVEVGKSPGASSTTVVVTKPDNLVIGQLMVANIYFEGTTRTVTSPGGNWVSILESDGTGGIIASYYCIATSTETAASTFTWTFSGAAACNIGRIMTFASGSGPGWDTSTPITVSIGSNNASGTETIATGVTPPVANSTLVIFTGQSDDDGGDTSAYAVTTSDPSNWMELFDPTTAAGDDCACSGAYANPRSETTSTGQASYTMPTNNTNVGQIFAIQPASSSRRRRGSLIG